MSEYGTRNGGYYTLAQNATITVDNRNYSVSQFKSQNFYNLERSYALVETNGSYATRITFYNNNSNEGIYDVYASYERQLQNTSNSVDFKIYSSTRLSGRDVDLKNRTFTVTGLNSQNYSIFNNNRFVVLVDAYQIKPIMILNPYK